VGEEDNARRMGSIESALTELRNDLRMLIRMDAHIEEIEQRQTETGKRIGQVEHELGLLRVSDARSEILRRVTWIIIGAAVSGAFFFLR